MPILSIKHFTTYRYCQPVEFGEHRMMLRPRDDDDQRVLQSELESGHGRGSLLGSGIAWATTLQLRISPSGLTSCGLSAPFASSTNHADFMKSISGSTPVDIIQLHGGGLASSETFHPDFVPAARTQTLGEQILQE
jgi:hypothetical protein